MIAYDGHAQRVVKRAPPPYPLGRTGDWDGMDDSFTAFWLSSNVGLEMLSSMQAAEAVEMAARDAEFDPVRDYLEVLAWDGTARLDHWLVDFFGAPAWFQAGPIRLARLAGAPIFPVFSLRVGPRHYRIVLGTEHHVPRHATIEEMDRILASIVTEFEQLVRQHPEQWFQFAPYWPEDATLERSFVAGLDSDSSAESLALVRAILAMALTLGIETIAEGIETETQRKILIDQGCQYGQGYLLGVPKPLVRAHGGDIRLVDGTIGATFRIAIPDRPAQIQRSGERVSA